MATKTLSRKKASIQDLQNEVELLRSYVIGQIGKDPEGEYRPEFVERVLKAAASNKAEHVFSDKESFLAYLNEDKS